MSRGRIEKALSGFYYVDTGGEVLTCRARGKFRKEGLSPLVGDRVSVRELGSGEGYVEEMLNGQKVIKVFCHEEKSLEEFKKINEELRVSADHANKFANILMPVNGNLGNISYVLCAVMGGVLASNGYTGLTLGALISFLTLNRNFTQPITQIAQISNMLQSMAAAAERSIHKCAAALWRKQADNCVPQDRNVMEPAHMPSPAR